MGEYEHHKRLQFSDSVGSLVFIAVFFLSGFVQLNDPDPVPWAGMYWCAALVACWTAAISLGLASRIDPEQILTLYWLLILPFSLFLISASDAISEIRNTCEPLSMKSLIEIEPIREVFGSLLVLVFYRFFLFHESANVTVNDGFREQLERTTTYPTPSEVEVSSLVAEWSADSVRSKLKKFDIGHTANEKHARRRLEGQSAGERSSDRVIGGSTIEESIWTPKGAHFRSRHSKEQLRGRSGSIFAILIAITVVTYFAALKSGRLDVAPHCQGSLV